jgi:iron complex outermembrane receptor protein
MHIPINGIDLGEAMKTSNRSMLFMGVTLCALGLAPLAQAQTAVVAPAAPAPAAEPSSLDEIIVTANRREENLQKASLSIEALSSEQLVTRGVTDSQSLNDVVPGLKIAYTSAQVQTFVRGVGDIAANPYTQASVSLNMDGVYIARSSAFGSVFFDTARVEVLRGPQGTLYGRNSSGGALNIISNAPRLGELGGYVSGEFGNYDLQRFQGALNVPLGDTMALRGALQLVHRDGYISDGSNDDESQAGRLRFLWKPSDTFTLNVIGEAAHMGGRGYGRLFRPALFNDPWTGSQDPRITPALFPTLRRRNPGGNTNEIDFHGLSAEANWDLGFATLTAIPAYRYVLTDTSIGADAVTTDRNLSVQTSFEARLAGEVGRAEWVVGAFAFEEDQDVYLINDQRQASPLSGAFQIQDVDLLLTEAWAVFGEVNYDITDRLRVLAGVRYTDEARTKSARLFQTTFTNGVAGVTAVTDISAAQEGTATTWRVGGEYDLTADSMLFYTASKGFKSGGFDPTTSDQFQPEFLLAHTLGLKSRFFDNSLQMNVEAFYWEYTDQQISFLGQSTTGVSTFITRNAGQATIKGISLDSIWQITDNDKLDLGLEYLNTNYDEFIYSTPGSSPAGTVLTDGCISRGPAGPPGLIRSDCSGRQLQRAPEWTANLRYSRRIDLDNGGAVELGATAKYQSDHVIGVNWVSPNFRQDAYTLFDFDATYTSPDGAWSLQGYVRNAEDEAIYQAASNQSSIAPTTGLLRGSIAAIGNPRTFGMRLRYNF